MVQAPRSLLAKKGPPGWARRTSRWPARRRYIRSPALSFAISTGVRNEGRGVRELTEAVCVQSNSSLLTPHSSFLSVPLKDFASVFLLAGADRLVELVGGERGGL